MRMQQALDSFNQYANDIRASVEARGPVCDAVDTHTRILENLPLVVSLARRFAGKSALPLLDRIQEGNLALIEAAEKYQPERGPFSPYAASYIVGYILRASSKESTLVSVSEGKRQHVRHIQKLQRTEEGITPAQIAERLGLTLKSVLELMNLHLEVLSLTRPVLADEEGTTLEHTLEADQDHYEPETIAMAQVTHASVQHLLCMLSGDERKVITLRYGLNGEEACPLPANIALRLRKTKDDIERIEERAMLKLQKYAQIYHLRESAA